MTSNSLFQLAIELFTPKILILLVAFIVSLIIAIKINADLSVTKGKKHAKHSVKAMLKDGSVYHHGEGKYGSVTDPISASYTYSIDGKTYEYRFMERAVPPTTITLYYNDNPKAAWR